MGEHDIGRVEEFPQGEGTCVEVDGVRIAVFNVEGDFYAVQDYCNHKGASLSQAGQPRINRPDVQGVNAERRSIYCPWHYWEWDLESGESVVNPAERLRTFDVEVRDDEVWVEV